MKLTPIFPPHIKPVRKGVYKTTCFYPNEHPCYFTYWNGKWWSDACYTKKNAFIFCGRKSDYQNKRWQGVLK